MASHIVDCYPRADEVFAKARYENNRSFYLSAIQPVIIGGSCKSINTVASTEELVGAFFLFRMKIEKRGGSWCRTFRDGRKILLSAFSEYDTKSEKFNLDGGFGLWEKRKLE